MPNVNNVYSNPGVLLLATEGGNYSPVGYTRGGISITPEIETREIDFDQSKFPVLIKQGARRYTINFRLGEVTKDNIQLAWSEPGLPSDGEDELSLGVDRPTPDFRKIKVYGQRVDGKYVVFEFTRCLLTGSGAFTFSKTDEGLLEATFSALYDDTQNRVGKVMFASTI